MKGEARGGSEGRELGTVCLSFSLFRSSEADLAGGRGYTGLGPTRSHLMWVLLGRGGGEGGRGGLPSFLPRPSTLAGARGGAGAGSHSGGSDTGPWAGAGPSVTCRYTSRF